MVHLHEGAKGATPEDHAILRFSASYVVLFTDSSPQGKTADQMDRADDRKEYGTHDS